MNYHPTIGALCGKLEMTRQNYYKGCKARRKGAFDSRHVEELVTRERRLQPRLGGRKLFHSAYL
jgi:hypothetical protein